MDLNEFKALNDTFGHEAGDVALQIMAERLRGAVRSHDILASIGGDEFICLLVEDQPCQAAEQIAERMIARTSIPMHIGDHAHQLNVSIGVAVADGETGWAELLRCADTAMYRAKKDGLNQPVFYASGMARPRTERAA